MRVSGAQRIASPYNPAVLSALVRDIEVQLNNLSEGKIQAATNASAAVPSGTAQSYQVGDFVPKTNPSKVTAGGLSYVIIGWVCTVAGAPGTWEEVRVLTADPAGVSSLLVANEAADATCFITFVTAATGNLPLKTNANLAFDSTTGVLIHGAPTRLKSYTVATLPAGTLGDMACVTDALAPAFLTAIVGGGAVKTPVFFDGTNWVAV